MDLFDSTIPGTAGYTASEPGRTSPPPARAPHAGLSLDWDEVGRPPRRRRGLLALAALPWVVVVVVLATRSEDPPAAPPVESAPAPSAPAVPAASETTTEPTRAVAAPPSATSSSPVQPVTAGVPTGPDTRGEAVGLALTAARAWLSQLPATMAIEGLAPSPGADQRYVEHVAVESVDHPAGGAAVITVAALVLPVEGEAYGAPYRVRLAVPVLLDGDHARLAGNPWPLRSQALAVTALPPGADLDDPDLLAAAAQALADAGYAQVDLARLERQAGWALIAHATAQGPGEPSPREHVVWLRSDVGRLVVAGTPTPPTGQRPPHGEPDGEPAPTDRPTEDPS